MISLQLTLREYAQQLALNAGCRELNVNHAIPLDFVRAMLDSVQYCNQDLITKS